MNSTKKASENQEYYIGIDISKNFVHMCSLPDDSYVKVPNTKEDIEKYFTDNFKDTKVVRVMMEATGGYEKNVVEICSKKKYDFCVLNSKRAKDLIRGLGINAKTDKVDANALAQIAMTSVGKENSFRLYRMPTENQRKLRQLVDRYAQLTSMSVEEQNHGSMAKFDGNANIESITKILTVINDEKNGYLEKIRTLIASDTELKVLDEILQSVPGVGLITSAMLMAYLPELGLISREKISSLAGLAPHPKDSGQKNGKRNTKSGRTKIKALWLTPMLCVIQYNDKIRSFYNKKVDEGKPKKVAIIASMHKLLIILNQMVRNGQKWNEHLQPQKTDSNANPTLQTTTQQPVQNVTVTQTTEVTTTSTELVTKEQVVTPKTASTKKTTVAKSHNVKASVKSVACKQKATTKGTTKTKKSTR